MQLHLERTTESNQLSAYGAGYFVVNDKRISSSIVISADSVDLEWPVESVAELSQEHLQAVIETRPELVILGSGAKHEFPGTAVIAAFASSSIGLEVMNTGAACRTYNVLLSEGRNVVAMLVKIVADGQSA